MIPFVYRKNEKEIEIVNVYQNEETKDWDTIENKPLSKKQKKMIDEIIKKIWKNQ